ncbi:MAG: glycosyltransferase [Lachnospiraceae bacterium]|nr:glycosyltransferase [Lachnospiraceae bacterium]
MRILFANIFVSFTGDTIIRKLKSLGHDVVEQTYYTPEDLYHDEKIENMIQKDLKARVYDCVFTVNIWPPVARVCHKAGIPYVAWSYDSPQNLAEDTDLSYDTNFLYIFDSAEVKAYNSRGIDRVFHMPLATDCDTWDAVSTGGESYDISLLGTLYESTLPSLLNGMDDYHQGYIRAIVAAQQKIYGYFLVDDLLTDELMEKLNGQFEKTAKAMGVKYEKVSTRQMAYSIGSYLTYLDRLTLLRIFGGRFDTHLFSSKIKEETKPLLKDITIHGWADYHTGMPRAFKASRINLNPSLRIIRSGISLRCLDIMGCGGFLLSSYQPELAEYFVPDEEVVLYDSYEDAVDKAAFYLEHEDIRAQIAANGYNKVRNEFSYEKQLGRILESVSF